MLIRCGGLTSISKRFILRLSKKSCSRFLCMFNAIRNEEIRGRLTNYKLGTKRNYMAKKLYVGGLSYGTTEDTLKETFSQAGTVETATIIIDKMSGRSKGFGFVEMSSDEEAQKAVEMFNGTELEGRNLTVNEARPMEARPRQGGFGGGNRGGGFGGGSRNRY
ncbi:MAG: putative glycine-rich RNA binding protein [Parcubacteria group bacterium GW2011_GWA1_42_7]|nr:MAG: putative glycine-rich RNA binding protein [Parcubacteria group bacterium GW2011_GWB1_42_6]KKS69967.1 MAG: putative glycine-rich RNA binding protein [Parcubacteria group bacterium GW2011_GWA1_42_7]